MDWIDGIPGKSADYGELTDEALHALERLEEELSKRGTLQAEGIDIEALSTASRSVLSVAAHIQAYRGAAFAELSRGTSDSFEALLALCNRFFREDLEGIYPRSPRANRLKTSAARDIYEMLVRGVQTLPGTKFDSTQTHQKLLDDLREHLDKNTSFSASSLREVEKVSVDSSSRNTQSNPTSGEASMPKALDARGRAELRQDILRLAERIAIFEPDASVTASMRGYAAWMEQRGIPEYNELGVVHQAHLPKKLRDDLLAGIATPSIANLSRLEERLIHSPDWFEGQHAAYEIAQKLQFNILARAIRERVRERLIANPDLEKLRYSNGEAFVPDAVLNWVKEAETSETTPDNSEDIALDIETALASLETELASSPSPREAAKARIRFAEMLAQQGHTLTTEVILGGLKSQIKEMDIETWDSVLINKIKNII